MIAPTPTPAERSGYLRVTQVLAPFAGLGHIPADRLAAAAQRGTMVHTMIEAHMQGLGIPEVPEQYKPYFESYLQWQEGKKLVRTGRIYYDEEQISGEPDCLWQVEEESFLVDFKTSYKENPTWGLQGAAYSWLLMHNGFAPLRIRFIHLSKDGGFPTEIDYHLTTNLLLWHSALDMYRMFFSKEKSQLEEII